MFLPRKGDKNYIMSTKKYKQWYLYRAGKAPGWAILKI